MKGLQENRWAKLCAVIILLCAAFGTGVFGVRTILSANSAIDDNLQTSARYYRALMERRQELE